MTNEDEDQDDDMAKDFAEWFYKSKAWKQTRAAYIIYCGGYCERCRREVEQGRRSLDDMKPIKIVHHKVYLFQRYVLLIL